MKRIAIFKLSQVNEANALIAANPPEQVSVAGMFFPRIVINYDDQTYPDSYKIEEIRALILSNEKQKMTSLISLGAMELDCEKFKKEVMELEAGIITTPSTKDEYDSNKEKEVKVKKLKDTIKTLEDSMPPLLESIARSDTRNASMHSHIRSLSNSNVTQGRS